MKNPFKCAYRVSSPYGLRSLFGSTGFHNGIDLCCDSRDVYSTDAGKVVSSTVIEDRENLTWQWGNYVCVLTEKGERVYYCHLAERCVSVGDTVEEGTKIGVMGNTGYSFGVHLHYEVRRRSETLNAAEYLGIKNRTGNAEEISMTKNEILKELGDRYIKNWSELPDWAKPGMRELLDSGAVNGGTDSQTDPDDINMCLSDIKTVLICKRICEGRV